MKGADFKALFPLKAMITQEIIDKADPFDFDGCVGARTLQSVLPPCPTKGKNWLWGMTTGNQRINGVLHKIGTIEDIDMMRVTEPQEVTFIYKGNLGR